MLKVDYNSTYSVKVTNKKGISVFIPKSQIRLDENEDFIIAAKSWMIESKELDEKEVLVDETIGMKLEKITEDKGTVYTNSKAFNRKLYLNKKHNMLAFNFKTNIFAIPNNDGCNYDNSNGMIYIGNQKDGYSFEKQVDEYFENVEEIEEIAKEIEEQPIVIDLKKPVKHMEYNTIKACVENDIPVYLYGPAGSGKNHVLQQIAEELSLEFFFTNSVQQEFKITGFIDAGGNYHETEFYKAFTNGGLFFLDEMDASIPEVLVLLNAAIANGYFEFPNGKEFADPNFRVVAAGNTIGSGADEQYTGRLVLDQATLDRFVSIKFDYDRNIEIHLAKGNEELVNFIRGLREKSEQTGIRATFSYRAITNVVKLEKSGMTLSKVLLIAVFKGMDKDTVNTLQEKYVSNKYYKAMVGMVA
jgi:hypothetical protein